MIDSRTILTAAHCFFVGAEKAYFVEVFLGVHNKSEVDRKEVIQEALSMERVSIHPNYLPRQNDIALVFLHKKVNWLEYPHIRPICLPSPTHEIDDFQGQFAVATGWGKTCTQCPEAEILQEADLVIQSHSTCTSKYPNQNITTGMLCAFGQRRGEDTCKGELCSSPVQASL